MIRPCRNLRVPFLIAAVCLVVLGLDNGAAAEEKNVSLGGEVGAGDVYTLRLQNLVVGAELDISVEATGDVGLLLLDERDRARWRNPVAPLAKSANAGKHSLSVMARAAGDHFLLIDNRAGSTKRGFEVRIIASVGEAQKEMIREKMDNAERELRGLETSLRRYFRFDRLEFEIGRCKRANAYSTSDTVVLCVELVKLLRKASPDRLQAKKALNFILMHEIAHVLLRQWGYPFFDNEEVADEFATALLMMFGKSEYVDAAADLFAALPSDQEYEVIVKKFGRHPLSVQRARNLSRWQKENDFVRSWQKIFVPHMRTGILQAMRRSSKSWVDRETVDDELRFRSATNRS